jgi:hypothetical protein
MKRAKKFEPVEYVVSADSPLDLSEVGRSAPKPARRETIAAGRDGCGSSSAGLLSAGLMSGGSSESAVLSKVDLPPIEPDSTPAVLTAEAVQRQANKGRHSERTVNGGKRLP